MMKFEKVCYLVGYSFHQKDFPFFAFVSESSDSVGMVPIMLHPSFDIRDCPDIFCNVQITVTYIDGYLICTDIKSVEEGGNNNDDFNS